MVMIRQELQVSHPMLNFFAMAAASAMTVWLSIQMLSIFFIPLALFDGRVVAQSIDEQDVHSSGHVDLSWHPPERYFVNDLSKALHSKGTYGFIFNASKTPQDLPYETYNWCNMPHVRPSNYVKPPDTFVLKYVEVIHRHHKRTPYASNCFPEETQHWYCDAARLFHYGAQKSGDDSAQTYWNIVDAAPVNPFQSSGFPGNCAFPQETEEALEDSAQHGVDLYGVYGRMLGLIRRSAQRDGTVEFRVTNNEITSQVAGALIYAMFNEAKTTQLTVQNSDIDSLEPSYSCPSADGLYASYAVGSSNSNWTAHLERSQDLFSRLDAVSGVDKSDSDWHQSYDHYFDNLSARLCHNHPLPCASSDPKTCISQSDADEVFRLGEYEYSFIYRDGGPSSLAASFASFGVWIAELSEHLRDIRDGKAGKLVYMHNIAHDGSISRLLSILQIQRMVWPGMGAEIVFELYQKSTQDWFVRVLWGGRVMNSSNPSLGKLDMIPLATLLAYFDGHVGLKAGNIPSKCGRSAAPLRKEAEPL